MPTGANHDPADDISVDAAIILTATIDGAIYARHGTSVDTRLTVIDWIPGAGAAKSAGHAKSLAELLALIEAQLPPPPLPAPALAVHTASLKALPQMRCTARANAPSSFPTIRQPSEETEQVIYAPKEAAPADADRHFFPARV